MVDNLKKKGRDLELEQFKKIMVLLLLPLVSFYIIFNGCVWLTISADDKLDHRVIIHSNKQIQFVHLKYAKALGNNYFGWYEHIKDSFTKVCTKKGFILVDSEKEADLVMEIKPVFFKKETRNNNVDFIFYSCGRFRYKKWS